MKKGLSVNQLRKKNLYEAMYNTCYVEFKTHPSIWRRIICWFNGDNPQYKILDPRNIRISDVGRKEDYSVLDKILNS